MLLMDDVLRLEGKGLRVGGTYLEGVWELREIGTRSQVMPAVPWGISGVSLGSVQGEASLGSCSEQPLAEESQAALYPRPSECCPGIPVPIPGMCVWHTACHRQETAPLEIPRTRCWFPTTCPAFSGTWDTWRKHQGTFLAVRRRY